MPHLFTLGTLFLAQTASASGELRVAFVGVHTDAVNVEHVAQIEASVRDAILASHRFDVLGNGSPDRALKGQSGAIRRDAFLAEGRQLLVDGRTHFQQAQNDDALALLDDAIRSLSAAAPYARSVDDLWQAYIDLAIALDTDGNSSAAQDACYSAAVLAPNREPNPAFVPPEIVERYRDARALAERDRGPVQFKTTPGELFVDGQSVGNTSEPHSLVQGVHYLEVVGTDGTWGVRSVEVLPGEDSQIAIPTSAPRIGLDASSEAGKSLAAADLYHAVGEHTEADVVLLVRVQDGLASAQLHLPRTDAWSAPVDARYSGPDAVVGVVRRALDGVDNFGRLLQSHPTPLPVALSTNGSLARALFAPIVEAEMGTRIARTDEPVSKKKKWVPWVAAGGGVAVAGITAAVLAATLGGNSAAIEQPNGTIRVGRP